MHDSSFVSVTLRRHGKVTVTFLPGRGGIYGHRAEARYCAHLWQCVVTDISLWVSGLEEGQVSQRCSIIPSLFDEETSCKIDVDLKVMRSSFRACSDQLPSAVRCSALPGLRDNTVNSPLANMVVQFDMIELKSGPLLWLLHLSGLTIEGGIWITSEEKMCAVMRLTRC